MENAMEIYVASLQQATSKSELSLGRSADQTIEAYVSKEIDRRVNIVVEAISRAAKNKERASPMFFTLPEFFWNIKWSALKSKPELHRLTSGYLNGIADAQQRMMTLLPERDYGKIVLLAGTVAVLVETEHADVYVPLNYCPISNNFQLTSDGRFRQSVWPKRTASPVDFGERTGYADHGFIFKLAEGLSVTVRDSAEYVGSHDGTAFGVSIDNSMVGGCPFSINICLDYRDVPLGKRDNEFTNAAPRVDFLIACGMPLNSIHQYPASVKFAIRNDGAENGMVEYCSVSGGRVAGSIAVKSIASNISMARLDL
jgi:hypothetical protein